LGLASKPPTPPPPPLSAEPLPFLPMVGQPPETNAVFVVAAGGTQSDDDMFEPRVRMIRMSSRESCQLKLIFKIPNLLTTEILARSFDIIIIERTIVASVSPPLTHAL
jgi:hypothetical protein